MKTLFWNITNNCNLNCRYCYYNCGFEERINKETSYDKSIKIIDDISKNFEKIIFTGGEPLLCPFLFDLIKKARQKNLFVQLLTNGVLLSKFSDRIVSSEIGKVSISLDSPIAKTNNNLRGQTELILQGILKLVSHKSDNLVIEIQQTITGKNIDSIPLMIEFCKSHNLQLWINPVDINPNSKMKEYSLSSLSEEKTKKLKRNLEMWLRLQSDKKNYRYVEDIQKLIKNQRPKHKKCNMGKNNFILDPEGNVYPCFLRKDILLGNAYEDKFEKILRNPLLKKYQKHLSNAQCLQLGCLCLTLL